MVATALDNFPPPPCAVLLGWELLDANIEKGWVRIGYDAKPDFCNPAGFIQGGLMTAMLDDAMGPAILVGTEGAFYSVTIDLNVHFLGAAKPGRLVAEGRVVQLGKTIGFVESRLMDEGGTPLARASASVRLVASEKAVKR